MSSRSFTLTVPADPTLRGLVSEIARRYLEICGGGAAAAASFGADVQRAVDASGGDGARVAFSATETAVEAVVEVGSRSTSVRGTF